MPEPNRQSPSTDADILIRQARAADLDDLTALEAAAFESDRLTRRRFAAHAKSANADLLVARHGDELAGYALVLTRRGGRVARLYSLAVAGNRTGRGLGARLLGAAETRAAARGAELFRLEVRIDNGPAIRLYEERGYRLIGQKLGYYADGSSALRYERRLGDRASAAAGSTQRLGRAA